MSKSKRNNESMLKNNDLMVFARKRRMDKLAHKKRVARAKSRYGKSDPDRLP